MTSPPTIAIQVENPAVNPISATNPNEGEVPLRLKERIPVALRIKYKKTNPSKLTVITL